MTYSSIMCLCLLTISVASAGVINLSTNFLGAAPGSYESSGWTVTGTPGAINGVNSGQLGPARVLPYSLTLGSATAAGASWISAGDTFGEFQSVPNGDNDLNHEGFYEFQRLFSLVYGGWVTYSVSANDYVYLSLEDMATSATVSLLMFDSSASMSEARTTYLPSGEYRVMALVLNLAGPTLGTPVGLLFSGSVNDTPEISSAVLAITGLCALALGRRRALSTKSNTRDPAM